jgi:hypothetical protein
MHDEILVTSDLKVVVSFRTLRRGSMCTVSVHRPTQWKMVWEHSMEHVHLFDTTFYNAGAFETCSNNGVHILLTAYFILVVNVDSYRIKEIGWVGTKLVIGDESAWCVETITPTEVEISWLCHLVPRENMTRSISNKRSHSDAFGAKPVPSARYDFDHLTRNCMVLDALWQRSLDSMVCVVVDDRASSFSLLVVRMGPSRSPRLLTAVTNPWFECAEWMATSFLDDQATSFVCAMHTHDRSSIHARSDRASVKQLNERSVFVCDSRSRDISFFRNATVCNLHRAQVDTLRFMHGPSNYVFLHQAGDYTFPRYAKSELLHSVYSLTRMHIFDLRTMSSVETVESPLMSHGDAQVRMVPRMTAGGITIEAFQTGYRRSPDQANRIKRVPVRTLDGRMWEPLGKDRVHAFHGSSVRFAIPRTSEFLYPMPLPLVHGKLTSARRQERWLPSAE